MEEEHECGEGCCGHEHEELTTEDLVEETSVKTEALIELLIQKGIITEEEFCKKYEEFFEDEEGQEEKTE